MSQNQESRSAGLSSTNISTQRAPQHQPTNRTWTMANVISSDHRRFLTNLFLNRELDRITSFARWPTDPPNVPPAALAKTGFFYLGDMDRTQCFSCGGFLRNWSLQDQAAAEHRIHFTGCRMVTGTESQNIPIPDENETAKQLAVDYPLRFPQNPYMRGQAQREQTFDRRWPAGTIRVTPAQIAEAGFFYLGERDRVKCWYCNGGLQNWELDDIPWAEHSKWFPNCQFLLRTKGQRFVSQHLSPHANLARPIIARQDGSPLNPVETPQIGSVDGQDIPPSVARQRSPTPPPTIIDPQVETLLIDRISANKEDNPNDIYGTVFELLDDVMKKKDEERRDQTQSIFSNPSGGTFQIGPGNTGHVQGGGDREQNFNIEQNQEAHFSGLSSTNISTQRVPQHQPTNRTWTMANVISSDHRRFLTNLFLNRELDRITSFARWPTDRPNVPPAALAKKGFFYLGDMDRTQCFSCSGVLRNWTLQDQAAEGSGHRIHFTGCRMVTGTETQNIPIPDENETAEQLAVDYPLRFPQNPHMRRQARRKATFDRWSARKRCVTPAQLAEAGFIYLVVPDRVKCWYCNGGLQHLELGDIPWVEHAKWFPNCQFLLRTKGQRFVSRHLSPNANLARPIIARQDGSPLNPIGTPQIGSVRGQGQDIPPSVARQRSPTPPPTIIDPQEEMRKRKERVKNIQKNSEVVKYVLAMGFAETIVETLLIDRISANKEDNPNDIYGTVSELLDDVMKKEDEIRQEEEEERDQTQSIFSTPSETEAKKILSMETDLKLLQEQLTELKDEQMCKICYNNKADMVFIPCGHIFCCMECTQAIKHCPVCRTRIESAMKTY